MSEQVVIKPKVMDEFSEVVELQKVSSGLHLEEFIAYQKEKSGLTPMGAINLRNSACDILNHLNPHDAVSNLQTTHLVVGYVQSGKTMSFTSLIELALDCKYKVIIVFAGITNNLLDQTEDRLSEDLICDKKSNSKFFKIHKNPDKNDTKELVRHIKLDNSIVVITVLKHFDRINRLTDIFSKKEIKDALKNETVIIVDDEADQASLNNMARINSSTGNDDFSSTYESILNLRNVLPGNSYVQYTATPQANILINALDVLSPKSHTLLIPGEGYCGGKLFFGKGEEGKRFGTRLIKVIPQEEVFNSRVNPLAKIPKSLMQALMLHTLSVILVTQWYESDTDPVGQLSMMIHTDVQRLWNSTFYKWVQECLSEWSEILENEIETPKKYTLLKDFESQFSEAVALYPEDNRPQFDEIKNFILPVLNDTKVYLITGDTNDVKNIKWDSYSSNILVGAQMLNRGFTVKNLATTYMPRYTLTTTNADTIEQRCRFFGYKEKYIRSCRVFLPQISIDNYLDYIDSEEELRSVMRQTSSMEKCGHIIMSTPGMRPTRREVLPKNIVTIKFNGMHECNPYNTQILKYNLGVIDKLIESHKDELKPFKKVGYDADNYVGLRKHEFFTLTPAETRNFLRKFQFTKDGIYISNLIRYLYYLEENGKINNVVFISMGCGIKKVRPLNSTGTEISTRIFEGPSSAGEKSAYLGDSKIYDNNTITIQIHKVEFKNFKDLNGVTLAINCPRTLAVSYTDNDN